MARDKQSKRFKATTPSKRLVKLAGMSASIAKNFASSRVKSPFQSKEARAKDQEKMLIEVGEQIAQTLGEMKGAVMKVGQIASQVKDLFPAPIAEALEKLQKDSPPMPFAAIEDQFRKELHTGPYQLYAWFEKEPFAAASIGQVHRARTHDGREVVVKIQYPGVEESCQSDLKQLKVILKLAGLVKVDNKILDEVFDEIRNTLMEELDYVHEAENLRLLRERHSDDEKIVIPQIIDTLCSKRVLTLTYEPGDKLEDVKEPEYTREVIDQIGDHLITMMANQLFKIHALHADPHPGNLAFRPDGTIVLYDFGAVKKVDPEHAAKIQKVMIAAFKRDYAGIESGLMELGLRKPNTKPLGETFYKDWLDIAMAPFEDDEFDFGKSDLHDKAIRKAKKSMMQSIESFQPSPKSMQIDRVINGHYWNLVNLGVRGSFRHHIEYYASIPQT